MIIPLTKEEFLVLGTTTHQVIVPNAAHFGLVALAAHGREDADVLAERAAAHVVVAGRHAVDAAEVVRRQVHHAAQVAHAEREHGWAGCQLLVQHAQHFRSQTDVKGEHNN